MAIRQTIDRGSLIRIPPERTYDSTFGDEGPLGPGWHPNHHLVLRQGRGEIEVQLADGRTLTFPQLTVGAEARRPEDDLVLSRPAKNRFVLREGSGTTYSFRPSPATLGVNLVFERRAPGGSTFVYHHDEEGKLRSVVDGGGRRVEIRWDGSRIESVWGPHPTLSGANVLMVAYAYDEEGRLVAARDPLGHASSYGYQSGTSLLVLERHKDGLTFYFEYDDECRCVHTWGDGGIFDHRLTYDVESPVLGRKITVVTNSLGHKTSYEHDGALVTRKIDPLGLETRTTRNAERKVTEEVDPGGGVTTRAYDARGNLAAITRPDGTVILAEHDAQDRPVQIVDALGGAWRFRYDDEDRVVEEVDPLGQVTASTYVGPHLASVIEPNGATTTFEWEVSGLHRIIDPVGGVTELRRDRLGRVVEIKDPEGGVERRSYDACGRLERVRRADGREVTFERDAEGRILRQADGRDDIQIEYFGMGQPAARTVNGKTRRLRYDTEGQVVGILDEFGRAAKLRLDPRGEVIEETTVYGVRFGYLRDARGDIREVRHPGERVTRVGRDAMGRVTEVLMFLGKAPSWDRPLEPRARAFSAELIRDRRGREVARSFLGFEIAFDHDVAGELRGIQVARIGNGQVDTLLRRKIEPRSFSETQVEQSVREGLARMADPSFGHLATAVLSDGVAEMCLPTEVMSLYREDVLADWRFGKPDSTVEGKDPAGRPSWYRYDAEGRVIERTGPPGTWTYAYDGAGRLSRVRRGDGRTVNLRYDAFGRCILRRDTKGEVTFVWDGDRPIHEVRGPSGESRPSGVRVHGLPGPTRSGPKATSGEVRIRGLSGTEGWSTGRGASSGSQIDPEIRTWLFDPDVFELWGKLEHDRAGQVLAEATRYVVSDHVGLPAALLDGTGALEWTDDGWEKRRGCFVAGTLVSTPKGLVPIEHIRVGDRVLTAASAARLRPGLPSEPANDTSFRAVEAARSAAPADVSGGPPLSNDTPSWWEREPPTPPPLTGAKPTETLKGSKASVLDLPSRTAVLAASLIAAAAAAPPQEPEEAWQVLQLSFAADGDEGHAYAIELLRPSAWLAEQGVKAPGDRLRLAFDELEAEGWATVEGLSPALPPPPDARNVVTMTLSHESGDVWELRFEGREETLRGTGLHPLYSLDRDGWVRIQDLVVGEILQTTEGAVAIEALERVRTKATLEPLKHSSTEPDPAERALDDRLLERIAPMALHGQSDDVHEVAVAEGGAAFRDSGARPLYSLNRGDWVQVRDVQVGERLQTAEGAVTVEALEKVRGKHRVYNVEVEGDHEYLVGETVVRAHNATRRRTQLPDDETFPSQSAARREALRRHGVATSVNNIVEVDDPDKNPNIRGPRNEKASVLRGTDAHGRPIKIKHHRWGHYFQDTDEFELPHYHGPKGEHLSYGDVPSQARNRCG